MEEVLLRFQSIAEDIFDSLDEKTLKNCEKVSRSWKTFIAGPVQKLMWIQTIKRQEKNIEIKKFISCQSKWRKLRIQDLKEFARMLPDFKDLEKEKMFFEKYLELNVKFEAKDENGWTLLHWAASDASSLVEVLQNQRVHCSYCSNQNFSDSKKSWLGSALEPLKVFYRWSSKIFSPSAVPNLNTQTKSVWWSHFDPLGHSAYDFSEFVDLILQNSTKLNIDLNAKNNDGQTAFHLACILGKKENVKVLTDNAETFKIDLTNIKRL